MRLTQNFVVLNFCDLPDFVIQSYGSGFRLWWFPVECYKSTYLMVSSYRCRYIERHDLALALTTSPTQK